MLKSLANERAVALLWRLGYNEIKGNEIAEYIASLGAQHSLMGTKSATYRLRNTSDCGRKKMIIDSGQNQSLINKPRLSSANINPTGEQQNCCEIVDERLKLEWA